MDHQGGHVRHVATASLIAALTLVATASGPAEAQSSEHWVTVMLSQEPEGLDGCNSTRSTVGRVIRQNVIETLTEVDPEEGSNLPRLAVSWEKVDDHTWRFQLREGVVFHDGAPFDAEAAAWAIARTMTPDLNCADRFTTLGDLEITGTAIDEHTLQLTTSQPEPILPTRIAVIGLVSPSTNPAEFVRQPVGTGPYVFDGWVPGEELTLVRNDSYWGETPVVEGARYVWRTESSLRAAMVELGEADLAPSISLHDATDPTMDFSYLNSETTYLRIELGRPPLDDLRVRMALNYAFDRESVRGSLLPADVVHATQIVMPGIPGHNHELDKMVRPYDPDRARELLAEAKAEGVPVNAPIWLVGRQDLFPNVTEVMEAMAAMYRRRLQHTVAHARRGPAYRAIEQALPRGPPAAARSGAARQQRGRPSLSVYNKFPCEGHQSFLCYPPLDELIATASTLTGAERVKAWEEVMRIIYEDIVSEVDVPHGQLLPGGQAARVRADDRRQLGDPADTDPVQVTPPSAASHSHRTTPTPMPGACVEHVLKELREDPAHGAPASPHARPGGEQAAAHRRAALEHPKGSPSVRQQLGEMARKHPPAVSTL